MGRSLPDGVVAVVKAECATCVLVTPVLHQLREAGVELTVFTQDEPTFPEGLAPIHDEDLAVSYHHDIETVPTLIRVKDGVEVDRTFGWSRSAWEALTAVEGLGPGLPDMRPGCGSLSVDPDMVDVLAVRFGASVLRSRRVEIAALEDEAEALFDRGWTDGLPVVAPTEARVLRMLTGTTRSPDDLVAVVPPDLVECTVEKVAVNAVMAGAKPEYMPVILAALEAACTDEFNIHGVLATTMPVGPVIIVNGPIRNAIGMNSGGNVLGQGNRANLAIGRAVQLVIRNVGGGRPGGVDRAAHGNPGKLSFCFAEDEEGSPWESLAVERGFAPDASTVTLFPGEGPRCVVDQLVARARGLGAHDGGVPAHGAPPEAATRLRRRARRRPRARSRVQGRGMVEAAGEGRDPEQPAAPRQRDRPWRRGHRRGHPGAPARADPAEVPPGRAADRARGRWRGTVLCHHRRLGER